MAKKAMINKQQKPAKFSTRAYTRCSICGRPHAVLRKYGICQHELITSTVGVIIPGRDSL